MPFVDNQGIKLHYRIFECPDDTDNTPVLLLHGFSGSAEQWRLAGFTKRLQTEHRLIAMDLRGHGKSSTPHSADAYSLTHRLSDIVALLDHLQVSRAHIIGYSMGGWLAFAMVKLCPHRIASLCIGGAHPYPDSMAPFRSLDGNNADAFIRAFETFIRESLSPAAKATVLQNDLPALVAAAQDRTDQSNVLNAMRNIPTLLFIGELDRRLAAMQTLAGQLSLPLLVLPAAGHAMAPYAGEPLLAAVQQFLRLQRKRPA